MPEQTFLKRKYIDSLFFKKQKSSRSLIRGMQIIGTANYHLKHGRITFIKQAKVWEGWDNG